MAEGGEPKREIFGEPSKDVFMETYRVGVRTPTFNQDDPTLWFAQLEGQFILSNMTSDSTKFYFVLSQLEPQHTAEVRDLIVSPPVTGKYDKLKSELIKRLSASQERKTKQLIMHEELGDRKPSQFLRHLQHLAGPQVPDDFIRTIWSSRLPSNLQTIVASQANMKLEDLAELADRIYDIVPIGQVACTSTLLPTSNENQSSTVEQLTKTVAELSRKLDVMSIKIRGNRRSHSRNFRKKQYHRSRSRSRPIKQPYCWYHYRFGDQASKCTQPCTYSNKQVNCQGSH